MRVIVHTYVSFPAILMFTFMGGYATAGGEVRTMRNKEAGKVKGGYFALEGYRASEGSEVDSGNASSFLSPTRLPV